MRSLNPPSKTSTPHSSGNKQRATQSTKAIINNRPSAIVQCKLQEMANSKGVLQVRTAKGGLPDDLKAGIEALSGYSLDDVKVHYNSSKPAELGALAYAQGNDIYLAPGQEKHLAHEAWHIVQQKQGRVRPTTQLEGGVSVNDNIGLEYEADRMAQRSTYPVQRLSESIETIVDNRNLAVNQRKLKQVVNSNSLSSIRGLTTQLKPKVFSKGTPNAQVAVMANELEKSVLFAKSIVDSNPLLKGVAGRTSGYLKAWVDSFTEFTTDGDIPQFFYARYGYAIETLATALFLSKGQPPGFTVHTQVSHGTTRPDFVFRKDGSDCAWVDITSTASSGHINNKQGGKWKTCAYVAEIFYNMPNPADFANSAKSTLTKEQIEALENANTAAAEKEQQLTVAMDFVSVKLAEAYLEAHNEKGDGLSKTEIKAITVEVCQKCFDEFEVDVVIKPAMAAGILAAIEELEVGEDENDEPVVNSGMQWAKYAFLGNISAKNGQELLVALGAAIKQMEEEVSEPDSKKQKR